MNLLNKIKDVWKNNDIDFEKNLDRWLNALNCGAQHFRLAKKQFHRWGSLKAYVSVSKSKSSAKSLFSIRFHGQEVANLIVENKEVYLDINKLRVSRNIKWFEDFPLEAGHYLWRGAQAKKFRTYFNDLAHKYGGKPDVRSVEHRVESKFITEMTKGSKKFGIKNLKILPVVIADKFPMQVPLPISANTGKPQPRTGYIDILARHRLKSNKTNLSVWELKKPGSYQPAASQAYIYAATLLHIIRHSKRGPEWYRLFGFKSKIPKSLEIEAVVAIDRSQEKKYEKERANIEKTSPLKIGNDRIKLCVAYYTEGPDTITLEKDPFIE